mmetsp:Transcript_19799/g.35320  ORF Transcript_19799/g.35320 Transcript_19799/m.35320 type:complete len:131 (+) Transcript_19799:830-1222(+)
MNAEWIETMHTVMDDNKMLTLSSNERTRLTASICRVFESSNLRNSNPATVSWAGIIYINKTDIGWAPYWDRWVQSHDDFKERNWRWARWPSLPMSPLPCLPLLVRSWLLGRALTATDGWTPTPGPPAPFI